MMLGWAVTFLIIALVAAVLGFGGIAAASAGIAKVLFFLFLVMCIIFFIFGWRGRGVPCSTILEDMRVSALRNFLMSASAEPFSFFVFDTVQSEGTNKSKSRI